MRGSSPGYGILKAGLKHPLSKPIHSAPRHFISPSVTNKRFTYPHTRASKSRWQIWLVGAAGAGGFTFSLLGLKLEKDSTSSDNSSKLSSFPDINGSSVPVLGSPAPTLTLEEASAILRKGEGSLTFDTGDGCTGRFDYVRYASNSPVEDDYSFGTASGPGGRAGWRYWGIYDGHAGWATSTVLREALIPYTAAHLSQLPANSDSPGIHKTIKDAFLELDKELSDKAIAAVQSGNDISETISALAPVVAGSCALLSIFDPINSILRVACVGDSRAVLGIYSTEQSAYTATAMSSDQTGFNEEEVKRISAAHPGEQDDILDAKSGRLLGIAVTRAFGDHRWKWTDDMIRLAQEKYFGSAPRPKSKTPPYMTAEPVIQETKIVRNVKGTTTTGQVGDFLIMASDGLWDHISNEDAVKCVEKWLQTRTKDGIPILGQVKDTTKTTEPDFELENGNFATWKVTPEQFVCEEENAATHLVKNAFGGSKRRLFRTVMSAYYPLSRNVRDDITVNVIFFGGVE